MSEEGKLAREQKVSENRLRAPIGLESLLGPLLARRRAQEEMHHWPALFAFIAEIERAVNMEARRAVTHSPMQRKMRRSCRPANFYVRRTMMAHRVRASTAPCRAARRARTAAMPRPSADLLKPLGARSPQSVCRRGGRAVICIGSRRSAAAPRIAETAACRSSAFAFSRRRA